MNTFIGFLDVSEMDIHLRDQIRSWGSSELFWCLRRFWRGFQSGHQIFSHFTFRTSWWVFLPPNLLGGIRYFCRVADIHLIICWWSLWDPRRPQKVPYFLGAPIILGGTDTRLQAMSLEVFYLNSCITINQWRRSLEINSLFYDRIILVAVFTLQFVEKEIIK